MKFNKKEFFRTLKYIMFTASAGVIQFSTTLLLDLVILKNAIPDDATLHFITDANTRYFAANTIGLGLSIIWNFVFNRKYTFKAASNLPLSMSLAFLFYVPFYPFQIWYTDTVKRALLASTGEALADVISTATVMLINFVLEFLWQRFVVFGKNVDTNDRAQPSATAAQTDGNTEAEKADAATEAVVTDQATADADETTEAATATSQPGADA